VGKTVPEAEPDWAEYWKWACEGAVFGALAVVVGVVVAACVKDDRKRKQWLWAAVGGLVGIPIWLLAYRWIT